MAYNKQYSHKDYEAFWRKDYSADIHNCRSYVASIIHGQGFSKERADRMVEEELVKLYPQGFSTKFDCGDTGCYECHPENKDKAPF